MDDFVELANFKMLTCPWLCKLLPKATVGSTHSHLLENMSTYYRGKLDELHGNNELESAFATNNKKNGNDKSQ